MYRSLIIITDRPGLPDLGRPPRQVSIRLRDGPEPKRRGRLPLAGLHVRAREHADVHLFRECRRSGAGGGANRRAQSGAGYDLGCDGSERVRAMFLL